MLNTPLVLYVFAPGLAKHMHSFLIIPFSLDGRRCHDFVGTDEGAKHLPAKLNLILNIS